MSEDVDRDGLLTPEEQDFVWSLARRDHGGDFIAAVATLIKAAYAAEQEPQQRWAQLEARIAARPAAAGRAG